MLSEKEVFQKAYALVSNPETWCRNQYFRKDEQGKTVARCSLGCILAVIGGDCSPDILNNDAASAVACSFATNFGYNAATDPIIKLGALSGYNDRHTHAEVVALWTTVGRTNGWLDPEQFAGNENAHS